jgi:hypothetical protein
MRQKMRAYAEANFDAVRGVDAYEKLLLTIGRNRDQS